MRLVPTLCLALSLLAPQALLKSQAQTQTPPQPPTPAFLHTPDVDLGYFTYGSPTAATPLIGVNGGPGLSHVYMLQNDVWPRLSLTRQVILYDQRGTGASTRIAPNAPQTMAAQVADLEALRAHLAFPKIDLLGDSYGGMLAMAYAAAHPDRIHKLVLSDSAPPAWKDIVHLFPQVFPDIPGNASTHRDRSLSDEALAQQQLRQHFMMIFWSTQKRDAYLANAKDLGYSPKIGEAVSKATASLNLNPALPKFHFPTLVLTGRYDMNVAPLTAWRIAQAIPGAKFVAFEESGHLPAYEEPDRYLQVVNDFLTAQ